MDSVVTELGLLAAVVDVKVVLRVAVTAGGVTLVTTLALRDAHLLGVSPTGEELTLVGSFPAGGATAVQALALVLVESSPPSLLLPM